MDEQPIVILPNFSAFIDAIEKSYDECGDGNGIENGNVQISSKDLTTALQDIETFNLNLNAMLGNLGQAVLFFDKQGICAPFYSKACLTMLACDPAGTPLSDVLGFSDYTKQTFQNWLDVVFSGKPSVSFYDVKKSLPAEIINKNNAYIELDYHPVYLNGDDLAGVLLIASDVTKEREAQQKMLVLQQAAKKTQAVSQNPNEFHELISDLYGFIHYMEGNNTDNVSAEDFLTLKRALHTFKGQAGMLNLMDLMNLLHSIEDDVRSQSASSISAKYLREKASTLMQQVDKEKKFAQNIFGDHFMSQANTKIIDNDTVLKLGELVADINDDAGSKKKLEQFIFEHFLSVHIFSLFQIFTREIIRICELKGKPIPTIKFSGDDAAIVPEHYGDFFKVIVHLARNIGEHALEPAEERRRMNKATSGLVNVNVEHNDKALKITISDDGRGIDAERIRLLLKEEGTKEAAQKSDADVIYHILDPDFSTNSSANITSGRGIGMNAIYEAVKNLGGELEITSDFKNSKGTVFVFTLPGLRGL